MSFPIRMIIPSLIVFVAVLAWALYDDGKMKHSDELLERVITCKEQCREKDFKYEDDVCYCASPRVWEELYKEF